MWVAYLRELEVAALDVRQAFMLRRKGTESSVMNPQTSEYNE